VTANQTTEGSKFLSKELKSENSQTHKAAENVHFVRRDLYEQMIIGLYFIYRTLEEE